MKPGGFFYGMKRKVNESSKPDSASPGMMRWLNATTSCLVEQSKSKTHDLFGIEPHKTPGLTESG